MWVAFVFRCILLYAVIFYVNYVIYIVFGKVINVSISKQNRRINEGERGGGRGDKRGNRDKLKRKKEKEKNVKNEKITDNHQKK